MVKLYIKDNSLWIGETNDPEQDVKDKNAKVVRKYMLDKKTDTALNLGIRSLIRAYSESFPKDFINEFSKDPSIF